MLKKLFLFFCLVVAGMSVSAQHAPGSWKVLPMSGTDFEEILDTPDKVYYLTGNALYAYDKETDETVYFTPGTKISDSGIKTIKYNKENKYLLCAYNNANIDLIYDNGKVVNLPEIKDANIINAKSINDVSFGEGRIYVATSFGFVVYDDQKHSVIESAMFGEPITRIAEMGDHIAIVKVDDGSAKLMVSKKDDRHNSIDKFRLVYGVGTTPLYVVGDNSYITGTTSILKYTINFSNYIVTLETLADTPGGKSIQSYKDGYYVVSNKGITFIGSDGTLGETQTLADSFKSQIVSFWNSPKSAWAANSEGLGNYDLSSATPTVLKDKFFPESSKLFNNCYTSNTPDGSKVYIGSIGVSEYHPSGNSGSYGYDNIKCLLESYDWYSGEIEDKTTYPFETGPGHILVDPVDPDLVYSANILDGLQLIKGNKTVRLFNVNNSPINSVWKGFVYDVCFDSWGNLWIGMWLLTNRDEVINGIQHYASAYIVLKKSGLDKLRANIDAELAASDWQKSAFPNYYSSKCDSKIAFSSKSNKAIHFLGSWGGSLWGYDTKGTDSTDDDVAYQYTAGFTDQDGATSNPTYKSWIVEDKKGDFWIGTTTGVFVLKDMDQIADGSSTSLNIIRPKVARNDGTNYADYLLASDQVLCIAVDSNNNKWIATKASGLFYVNEDGTEILAEFNSDNTPMVSNVVTMVACNPNGNDVLIGTPEGLYVYSSDSAPAADDYSSVYAYPNPVRPDYTGWITINGLMDNSLVKITDAQGHVVWQSQSEGGMAIWDGCDTTGNRVRSGVYMVFASQNASGNSSGAVTKIVVIN